MESKKESQTASEPSSSELTQEEKEAALKKALAEIKAKFPNEDLKMHEDVLRKIFFKGQLPKDAMGFSTEFVELLYAVAHNKFISGNYNDAAEIYRFLLRLNPVDFRYPFALAACYHRQKEYLLASTLYMQAAALDLSNPMTFYHASDCFIKLNNPFSALLMIDFTLERLKDEEKTKALRNRAEMMRKTLKLKVDKAMKAAQDQNLQPQK